MYSLFDRITLNVDDHGPPWWVARTDAEALVVEQQYTNMIQAVGKPIAFNYRNCAHCDHLCFYPDKFYSYYKCGVCTLAPGVSRLVTHECIKCNGKTYWDGVRGGFVVGDSTWELYWKMYGRPTKQCPTPEVTYPPPRLCQHCIYLAATDLAAAVRRWKQFRVRRAWIAACVCVE
jgi:hypothetical protein